MITNTSNRVQVYGENDTDQVIPFAFPITAPSDLNVVAVSSTGVGNTLALTTDYTLTMNGDGVTGTVNILAAWPTTSTITVYRLTPPVQNLDLEDGGNFSASDIEAEFDTLTKLLIENRDFSSRCIQLAPSDPASPGMVLPNAVNRASGYLTFDASGNPTVSLMTVPAGSVTYSSFGTAWVDLSTAAAGRTALGLGTSAVLALSTDGTLASDSDSLIPSQKAVKTYVDAVVGGSFVDPASVQTITGVKTFSVSPIVPTPTTSLQAATKGYVDAAYNSGQTVQVVNTAAGTMSYFTGNTLALTNSIPTNTQGNLLLTRTITPTATGNTLRIDVDAVVQCSVANQSIIVALFQGSTCVATAVVTAPNAYTPLVAHLTKLIIGSLPIISTTFTVRAAVASGNLTFNGVNNAGVLGGTLASHITIAEIHA